MQDYSEEYVLKQDPRVWVCVKADQGLDRSGSLTATGPIRAISVGNPTVDDTIDESRLEHTRAILPVD